MTEFSVDKSVWIFRRKNSVECPALLNKRVQMRMNCELSLRIAGVTIYRLGTKQYKQMSIDLSNSDVASKQPSVFSKSILHDM